ncbi:MAG: methyltransferase domain-containing protein [Phycisphaerae bacterium]|nr:methyltransferase domain-containing protein [Phycisphaerae bacterium]
MVWLYLQEKTTLLDGSPRKVLHIAPEPCLETKFRRILGTEYITADLNNPKAQIKMDVTKIPFDNETFDVIYCSHVLEHVPDDRKAIREFYRVLKKDSWALILVPINVDRTIEDLSVTNPKERERLFGQHDHVRKYGPDFIKRVKESGFHAEIVLPQDFLNTDRIRVCGIGKGTPLFKCNKN